ncbi:MAG: transcription-repair coupling factor [Omnitrophica WOR_2 bacterium RBG_13_44_8b]|nr:MAG: transcription-repair coupling factor [Omnitrophica WOR_2 bacterium RBG_13_44_8b]
MFKSLKLYSGLAVDLERLFAELVEYGYKRQDKVSEEGDFSRRGGIIDIFPASFELPVRLELDNDRIASIKTFFPASGESLWEHRIVIVLPIKKISPHKTIPFSEESPLSSFIDLNKGDYVVHNQYGIGRFLGMERIKIKDKSKDHLVIEYDRQEKLYVPVESMHLVQKYIAFHVRRPKLYRLGGKEWLRTKNRAKKGIQKLAWELLTLQALRLSAKRTAFSQDSDWQREFEATFPYKETPDQIKAAGEVRKDMESTRPMDRLLCGDVGYGKTEVAMRAAFKAVMDNKQVAYLVPTTILAEQHYQNFSSRLKDFPVNLQMLCRFKTDAEQKQIIEGLAKGTVDIIIGTHRLLSEDVTFNRLGLVIIDEEQRFGVKHKEKLKTLRLTTDVLTLTATPIPRTLYMSLMGARDLSVINTPPENRLPIKTVVVEYDQDLVHQAVLREVNRKGQVFYLHNRVKDIEKIEDRLAKILPAHVTLAIAHGQMPASALEKTMAGFLKGNIDCLVCTMIIESGIDIPNVNTIIVENAHMFGLSDLHQLRGRVGRFDRPAYAYFMVPQHEVLDTDARKRLKALDEYSQLGAGFNIAMEDLEIRGAGNLLGVQQHGFIQAVGFDLYCRLLKETVTVLQKASPTQNA